MGLVKKMKWGAIADGDNVVLNIGNADIAMHYEDAFKMSQVLRVAAKRAKLHAGDISAHWSIIANLADVQTNFEDLIRPNLRFSGVKNLGGGT